VSQPVPEVLTKFACEWWMTTASFLFDEKTPVIATKKIKGHEKSAHLKAFTIATTIYIDEFKNN